MHDEDRAYKVDSREGSGLGASIEATAERLASLGNRRGALAHSGADVKRLFKETIDG